MSTKTKTDERKIPVLVIFAPTASGKTALTRELFSPQGSHFILNAEIISADSQAVYKGMDIGTAKPEAELCRELPHHLIDILTPDQQFNVSDFVDAADNACCEIFERGKLPVICGGTGFYIRNFLYGLAKTPVSDEKLRNELKERIQIEGNEALYEELKKIDPESAAKIHPNDAYRICRALEVFYLSGKTRTEFKIEPELRSQYDFLFLVLEPPREVLYERIKCRVDQMLEAGLEQEVKRLVEQGYTKDSPGLKAIGYSEWFGEDGKLLTSEAREKIIYDIKHHSCKYAKKQYTYIRGIPGSTIINFTGSEENFEKVCGLVKVYADNYLISSYI